MFARLSGTTRAGRGRYEGPGQAIVASTVRDGSGTTWSGCQTGDKVVLFQQPEGETSWQDAGASAADVPKGTMTFTWVLPTIA